MSPPRIRPSVLPFLSLMAALAWAAPSRAEVVYALVVDPVRSPGSTAADVRVVLADYAEPRPFQFSVGLPFARPPDTGVAVRVSHLRSTFSEVVLSGLEGILASRDGTTLDGDHLTGSYLFPPDPARPSVVASLFVSLDCGLLAGPVQVAVIGPGREVETITGRFELMSPSANPPPSGVVLFVLGLAGVGVARVLEGWRVAA